jgi:multiple sugar transport system substrate-binding protein
VLRQALAGGGAVALAACGQGSTGSAAAPAAAPKGTVEFWQWGAVYVDGFGTLTKEFNDKGSGVTVNFVASVSDNYWNKLTAAMSAATGPDVYLMNDNARTWATKGLMRALDDLLKKDKTADQLNQSIIKSFREWYDVGGKQMGWGWDYSTIATVYNVAHLREAGLKPPAELGDKWDWATFKAYAQKLNRPTASPPRWGAYAEPGVETGWLNFVRANGADYFSDDRKKCTLGAAPVIEAVDYISSFVTKDKTAPTRAEVSAIQGTQTQAFINGQISIGTYGDWKFTPFKQAANGLEWDVAPVPFKNGKTGSSANFRGMVVNPQTKVLEAAFEWMKFALSKPVQDRVPLLFNEVPARLDSAQEVYANADKAGPPKGRASLKASILATKALPALDKIAPDDFYAISTPVINDIWDSKVGVKDGLTKAQDQINALIQQYGT